MEDAVLTVLADTLNPGLSQKRILSLIRNELKAQLPSPVRTSRESGRMVADIDTKIQRIKQAIMAGVSPETFVGELAELNRLKAEHESRPKDSASQPVQTVDLERLTHEALEYMSDLRRALGQMDRMELKRTLQEMVDKIEIDKAGKRGFVYLADLPGAADPLGKSETFTHLSGRNRPPALTKAPTTSISATDLPAESIASGLAYTFAVNPTLEISIRGTTRRIIAFR
jgi:hypothetical protein